MSPATPRLIDSAQLRGLFPNMGRSSFYKMIQTAGFPTPVQPIAHGDYFWFEHEVLAHLESCRVTPGPRTQSPRAATDLVEVRQVRRPTQAAGDGLVARPVRKVAA